MTLVCSPFSVPPRPQVRGDQKKDREGEGGREEEEEAKGRSKRERLKLQKYLTTFRFHEKLLFANFSFPNNKIFFEPNSISPSSSHI